MVHKKRLVIGISGASGAILGIEVLKALKNQSGWETHLVISNTAAETIAIETGYKPNEVEALADCAYVIGDLRACISSGTFETQGMAIVPCSMKTAAGIACGYSDNLLLRAADVTLKEGRKLVLAPRECPLSELHLENLLKLSRLGAVILPPVMSFYNEPRTIDDMIKQITGKALCSFGIEYGIKRWGG